MYESARVLVARRYCSGNLWCLDEGFNSLTFELDFI